MFQNNFKDQNIYSRFTTKISAKFLKNFDRKAKQYCVFLSFKFCDNVFSIFSVDITLAFQNIITYAEVKGNCRSYCPKDVWRLLDAIQVVDIFMQNAQEAFS